MTKEKSIVRALVVIAVLAALPAVALAATELARVNTKVITLEDFNLKYKENLKFFHFNKPSKENVLDDLIKRELGVQEAKRIGLDKDPEVQERMETVLYHALLEKSLGKDFEKINVADDEARRYYQKNPEVRTSHIFVSVPANADKKASDAAFSKIKKIQDQNLRGEKMSFAEAAQRFSEGPSAPMGGDIDFKTRDQLDPAYYEAAVKLGRPGQVSGIVRSQFGFHIIKLTALRSWDDTDKSKIKRLVFEERRQELFDKYMGDLRKKYAVSIKGNLLKE
ncbi:MAG: peptidylprolyl isomerase [Bdellovibrionales bacterium]|nr:peptidylprolyl isomerase [Bdellovibrionales bacterium]